jgi:hypothetical protein
MPTADSASHVNDTSFYANDSLLLKNDSVFTVDSLQSILHKSDSTELQIATGFEGAPHPSFPGSENWVFGSILFFFFLLVFSFLRSSNWIYESFRTFFQVKKRSSIFVRTTINDFQSQLLLVFFSIGVMTLYVHTAILTPMYGYKFSDYLFLLGVVLLFLGLKSIFIGLIGFVFVDKTPLRLARESYIHLLIYLGILQFPVLILQLYSPENFTDFSTYIGLFVITLALIILLIKLFQIFYDRFVVSFYILLYLCTLEIIPFILLFWLFRMIILDV